MVAYYLSAPCFFKLYLQTSGVTSVLVSRLYEVARIYLQQRTDSNTVYSTAKVAIDGTEYSVGMFVSVGQEGGLPPFGKIEQILLVK